MISIDFVRTQHNLADHLTKGLAKDLSKAGKRFAFVRFIKVDNVDRLVGNLYHQPVRKATHTGNTFASVVKGNLVSPMSWSPALVLTVYSTSFESVKVSSARSSSSRLMNGGGIGIEGPLRTRPLQVVMAFSLPFGLAMVLLESGPEPEVEAVFI
uniref:Uncharacterized protein n=1 Tax=Tanacetum cinerariifolium TaxID=118510 RepID=A0A6L2NP34_TANCI|nr:hypothetical protein [Tanacetum cinerariifolium]